MKRGRIPDNMKIKERIAEFLRSGEAFRYVIAGIGTTLCNLLVFSLLRYGLHVGLNRSNFIAILCSIVFAFFANKFYAFRSLDTTPVVLVTEFIKFLGGRLITLVIEMSGVYVLAVWLHLPEMFSKIMTQFIVVVANYVISKIFVFQRGKGQTILDWVKERYVYVIAFVFPVLLFLLVCLKFQVTPFGGKTLMIIDSLHQYIPFFSDYYDKLTKTGEFLYSWNGAGGYNFLTLWAYYLSSPFNLLIMLFDKAHINTAMTLIIGLKICLSSVTMTYFLVQRSKRRDITAVMFGVCYAFSNYVIGYYWNIMWLDVLLLAPLVMLGLERLIDKKDIRLYVVTLFAALFCNFYIGFMLCIFLVLWFLLYPHQGVKAFFLSGIRFALSSVLAAGMAAFVLIPTYYGIMLTGPADSEFPVSSWYGNVVDILKKFCLYCGSITNQADDGGVNLYCGMLPIFLVVMYLTVKEISLIEKIKRFLLLAFLVVSFDNTVLNYIWHGFHDQFGIPNRFSFLMIFVLLLTAHETIGYMKDTSFWKFLLPLALLAGVVLYNNEVMPLFEDQKVIRYTMIAVIAYFMAFMLQMMLEWKNQTLYLVLLVLVFAEVSLNAFHSFEGNGQVLMSAYFEDSETMRKAKASVHDDSLYREELSKNNLVDENFWLNLRGVGIFGSTANGDAVTLLGKMGFYTAANEHLYNGATPLTDSLLGVKYLYKRQGDYFDHGFDLYKTVDGVEVLKNPYALSFGYMVKDSVYDWDYEQYQPADVLNDFVHVATGVEGTLFTEMEDHFGCSGVNCDVNSNGTGDGTYAYARNAEGDLTVTLTITAPDDRPIYIRATGTNLSGIVTAVNGVETSNGRYFFQLLPVGETKAGDQITVTYQFNGSQDDNQTVNLKAYSYDESVFEETYAALSKNEYQISDYTSHSMRGTIHADEDGMMMTSIINEPGWKVYVDGEEEEMEEIGDCFAAVWLSKGDHQVEFRFVPQTLPIAALISLVSFLLFLGYMECQKHGVFQKKAEMMEQQDNI